MSLCGVKGVASCLLRDQSIFRSRSTTLSIPEF